MFYAHVFSSLARHGVRYAVAGGLAVNLHGIPRMTADIDLVVDLDSGNLKRFLEAMNELGFRPRLPVKAEDLLNEQERRNWVTASNLHAFTFWSESRPFEELDLLLVESQDSAIFGRSQVVEAGELKIPVVSIEDLIYMKIRANRLQDKADIEALLQVKDMDVE